MKTPLTLLTIIYLLLAMACTQKNPEVVKSDNSKDSTEIQTADLVYACPMHPEITSKEPGSCSECGMDLEKKKE